MTFKELRQDVACYAAAMKKMGVKKGDRVVGEACNIGYIYLPASVRVSHVFNWLVKVVGFTTRKWQG